MVKAYLSVTLEFHVILLGFLKSHFSSPSCTIACCKCIICPTHQISPWMTSQKDMNGKAILGIQTLLPSIQKGTLGSTVQTLRDSMF
jgi:hypothetical protein